MPTLHWIGKDKVLNHHQDVPYRILEHQHGFSAIEGEQKAALLSKSTGVRRKDDTMKYKCPPQKNNLRMYNN